MITISSEQLYAASPYLPKRKGETSWESAQSMSLPFVSPDPIGAFHLSVVSPGRQSSRGKVAPPRPAPKRPSLLARARSLDPRLIVPWLSCFFRDFSQGLGDSVSLHRTFMFLIESPIVRINAVKSILLNGVLFLGSHYFYQIVLGPGLTSLGAYIFSHTEPPSLPSPWLEAMIAYFVYWAYQLMWMWPFYLLSFFVSVSLNQEVAMAAFQCREQQPTPPGQAPIPVVVVDAVGRFAMVYLLLFQTIVLSWIPYIGSVASFIFTCWLDAFYAFQYVWALRGVRVERQTRWIEHDWSYYLGFGCFTSMACHCTAFFVGVGCYAMIFPFCILTAMTSESRLWRQGEEDNDTSNSNDHTSGGGGSTAATRPQEILCRAPVFWVARRMSSWVMGTVNAAVTGGRPGNKRRR